MDCQHESRNPAKMQAGLCNTLCANESAMFVLNRRVVERSDAKHSIDVADKDDESRREQQLLACPGYRQHQNPNLVEVDDEFNRAQNAKSGKSTGHHIPPVDHFGLADKFTN